jgi:hypothetical protein
MTDRSPRLTQFVGRLFAPVDVASLVYFRVLFGGIMLWEVWRYFDHDWIRRYWITPTFHFTYYGFGWVRPWPGHGMYLHFFALGVLALFILLGFCYRISAILFFFGFTYTFLLEQARYLNHFYFVCLLSFLMMFTPAHRAASLDVFRRPDRRGDTVPAWSLWLLRAQVGIVYFYGGLAKINADWLRGEPLRDWLAERTHFPLIGRFFTEEWMVYFFAYGGLLFDLLIVPLLLWKRTRVVAFCLAIFFNVINARLFEIGIFPWFMLAGSALFFEPDWPRHFFKLDSGPLHDPVVTAHRQRLILLGIGLYLAVQLLLPLRHHFYPGAVSWTEEGHLWSWHMKLRDKSGTAQFFVTNANQTGQVNLRDYLDRRQIEKMSTRPDMILQFAHHLAADQMKKEGQPVVVRARVFVSLNGRKPQRLIDPTVNLAATPRDLWPAPWIVPLDPLS